MRLRRLLATGLLLAQVGCQVAVAGADRGASGASSSGAADGLVPEIRRLIGDAACSRSEECHVVGVGARACGGPEGYWAWSAAATDERALESAVQRQAAERRAELERQGMLSTCEVLPRPQATCRVAAGASRGRCMLQRSSLAD